MNPDYFGDSYDIVKRFFVDSLKCLDYSVFVEPMFTGEWNCVEHDFYRFIGAAPIVGVRAKKSALLLDPDTGIGKRKTKKHVSINCIADYLKKYDLVFTYDQSFSYNENANEKMIEKLNRLDATGNGGFYYDSHAKFLFSSGDNKALNEVRAYLVKIGLPSYRLVEKQSHNPSLDLTPRS